LKKCTRLAEKQLRIMVVTAWYSEPGISRDCLDKIAQLQYNIAKMIK
jgi:hypothetical protein